MNQFYNSPMGRHFFEGSLPKLIKAIDSLANSVDTFNKMPNTGDTKEPEEEKLSFDLGFGVSFTVTKKGAKDDYPGFWIDIEVDGESHPFVAVEKVPQISGDGFVFSAAVWGELGKEDPTDRIKSQYTFTDAVNSGLID